MNISTILCPTDFSPLSYEALSVATSLARDNSARLVIAHVMERPVSAEAMAAHTRVPVPSAAELSEKLK